jgi:putative ABC transport system permease protein
MNVADTLRMALANLGRRKGRTALTAAGVIVGVATLVLMVSLGLGLRKQVLRLFQTDDAFRTLSVSRIKQDGRPQKPGGFNLFSLGGQLAPITEDDLAEMRKVPGVALALPDLNMLLRASLETEEGSRSVDFFPVGGVAPEEEARYRGLLVAGNLWGAASERACLLPTALLEFRLGLKPRDVLGRKLTFGAMADEGGTDEELVYTVAGVFDSDRVGFRGRMIFLPMERARAVRRAAKGGFSFFPYKEGTYASAEVRLADPRSANDVRARLRNSGFQVLGAADVIESINLVFLIVEGFMAAIGAIGLVVSLFGIANTMAMAVLERTREIGIMKALGARNRDISRLFLGEAAAIGVLGGIAGLAAGFLAGKLLDVAARGLFDIPERVSLFHVTAWLAAGSVVFSVFVSVLAGILPARRAARLDPVESLRYE